jgi:hypothetical protein
MEPQTTLERAQRRVELHAISAVHLQVARIVFPDYAELDDALGNRDDLESCPILGVALEQGAVLECADEL